MGSQAHSRDVPVVYMISLENPDGQMRRGGRELKRGTGSGQLRRLI